MAGIAVVKQQTFFNDGDYAAYVELMAEWCREKWRGYLWQGRFVSFVMDEDYLLATARYVELNPVRAGLVGSAEEWLCSSARAH